MTNYEILNRRTASLAEISELLEKINEDEVSYREEKLKEYLKEFNKLSKEDYDKAMDELKELGLNRLDEEDIVKILNILPKNGTELRAITSGSGTILVDEEVNKILDVLSKYR